MSWVRYTGQSRIAPRWHIAVGRMDDSAGTELIRVACGPMWMRRDRVEMAADPPADEVCRECARRVRRGG